MTNKQFSNTEQTVFEELLIHRRDVRGNRFLSSPIAEDTLRKILHAAELSPSVGFSQPWEFVIIKNQQTKQAVADVFAVENTKAEKLFSDEKRKEYAQLKLEGILKTPVNIAVFYRQPDGPVLGQTSMPDMGEYSVVCAIQNMWLMARALNIGMGWVSILDPEKVKDILKIPEERKDKLKLVAYLCFGHVDEFLNQPELEILKWDTRKPISDYLHQESYTQQ